VPDLFKNGAQLKEEWSMKNIGQSLKISILVAIIVIGSIGVAQAASVPEPPSPVIVPVAATNGVEVEVPYAVTDANWWTGLAIKNLDASSITDTIKIDFFDQEGVLMRKVVIDPLEPREIYSQTASNIYSGSLPLNYSIRVSQVGLEELAVTVFVGNTATGGFACQTYKSQAFYQATAVHSWDQILPTAQRFELVMDDEAVLDRETGLVWERNTSDTKYDWYEAQVRGYQTDISGRKGWRLPTVDELATLVDSAQSKPSLPDNHPFTNVKSYFYWSSTANAKTAINGAFVVNFDSGHVGNDDKTDSFYVRAVRSGQ
jgi:hypothetical protein